MPFISMNSNDANKIIKAHARDKNYQLEKDLKTGELSLKSKFSVEQKGPDGKTVTHNYSSKLIGQGAKGKVYEVIDIKNPRKVYAVKIPKVLGENLKNEFELNKEISSELVKDKKEVKKSKGKVFVESKVHIIKPLFPFEQLKLQNGKLVKAIVMERLIGSDLFDYLTSDEKNPHLSMHKFLLKLAKAIYDYNRKYSHRDIKFENIFITQDGEFKIFDNETSKKIGSKDSNDVATFGCSNPVLFKDSELCSPKKDMYSYGCLMFQLLLARNYCADSSKLDENFDKYSDELHNYRVRQLSKIIKTKPDRKMFKNQMEFKAYKSLKEYAIICRKILQRKVYKDLQDVRTDLKKMHNPDKKPVRLEKYNKFLPEKNFAPSI